MAFSVLPHDRLIRPREIFGAPTPEIYLEMQRASILAKKAQFQFLNWRLPFVWIEGPVPLKVSDSHWQLICGDCGGTPAYDPEWQLAACFTCGAIYYQAPPNEWREIERVLVCRPNLYNRHVLPGQTLADLIAENQAHGDPVPPDLLEVA